MRKIGLYAIFVYLFFTSPHIAAMTCSELFDGATNLDAINWPLRGIQEGLGQIPAGELSQVARYWQGKIGQPVVTYGVSIGKGKHRTVHLSPNEHYAISYSTTGEARVFDTRSGRVKARIPYGGQNGGYQEGILMVSNNFFALAGRRKAPGSDPMLFLYDMKGNEVAREPIGNQRVTGSLLTPNESFWIVSNLSSLSVFNLQSGRRLSYEESNDALNDAKRQASLVDNYITTSSLSPDGKTLFVAYYNSLIGTESARFLAIDFTDLQNSKLLGIGRVKDRAIHKIDPRPSDGTIYVQSGKLRLRDGDSTSAPLNITEFPIERFVKP